MSESGKSSRQFSNAFKERIVLRLEEVDTRAVSERTEFGGLPEGAGNLCRHLKIVACEHDTV